MKVEILRNLREDLERECSERICREFPQEFQVRDEIISLHQKVSIILHRLDALETALLESVLRVKDVWHIEKENIGGKDERDCR